MKIATAIALLLAPSVQGVSVKNLVQSKAKFPKMPSSDSITTVMASGLEMGKEVLSRAMYSEEKLCDEWAPLGERPYCYT